MTDYGMFTPEGNTIVDQVVITAKNKDMQWRRVYDMLVAVSNIEGFEEATDTVVREAVYIAMGYEE